MNTEKKKAAGRCIAGILWFFSIFVFFNAFNFQHNPPRGWYRQFLPDIGNAPILEVDFLDSLNGYAKTGANSAGVSYLLKTTTGGDNWTIARLNSNSGSSAQMKFLNKDSGIIVVNLTEPFASDLFRTTDGGNSWDSLRRPATFFVYDGISVLSMNEIWAVCNSQFTGSVWRSLDGGQSWQRMLAPLVTNNPDRIYMVNSRIGFVSDGNDIHSYVKRTTDGGMSWNTVSGNNGWTKIYFKDSLAGWKSFQYDLLSTADGGHSWKVIFNAQYGNPDVSISSFSIVDDKIIWGVDSDANILFPNNQYRGVILKTTNAGLNWGYQLPDTSFRMPFFVFCDFVNSKAGWAYNSVHTITGGDTITYPLTSISEESTYELTGYQLHQNFPNPFNPSTTIRFDVRTSGNVSLKVFDVLGREIAVLADEYLRTGSYERVFDGSDIPSGVYVYSLNVDGKQIGVRRMTLVK